MITHEAILERTNQILYRDMGQCFKVSRVEYDKENQLWYAFVNYSYPTVIDDPANQERYVKSIIFNDLFKISFDSNGNVVYKLTYEELEERISYNIAQDLRKIGEVLIDITSEQLVKIATIRNAMIPFERIFIEIEDSKEQKLTPLSIKKLTKINKKIDVYLELLEALSLLRSYSNEQGNIGYVKGNRYIEIDHLSQAYHNRDEKLDFILAYVLKHGYSLLLEKIRLYAIVPFVRYQEVYYYTTYRVGEIIHFDEDEFVKKTIELYGTRPNKTKMKSQLEFLIKTHILEKDNHYYIGNEEVFRKLREQLPSAYA